ncbi:glycosyltransferase family 2 protein [Paenibacillus taiwanensis]|uniref:glycosyltransferase family 2 protein n=1 Tax=Paenibacillus taiwanensis TaxID=401638 RepID=UPI0003FC9608|nr:glycosyltransferase family 2 protein [Paenibacillus taiwanensis]
MKISFVIPSYNSAPHLVQGLTFLASQQLDQELEMEVIVVDDGSSDGTKEAVASFHAQFHNLLYLFRPRDELSNRARARNIGLEQASGDLICFLDAGIVVPSTFTKGIAAQYATTASVTSRLVLLHVIYGVPLDTDNSGLSAIENLNPYNFQQWVEQNKDASIWQDYREPTFKMLRDRLDGLPAPWEFGLAGAITVPASLARQVNGFDDTFMGWGTEDIEFAYRLYLAGASFRGERQAYALHLPHPTSLTEQKMLSDRNNRIRMHHKHYRMETELFVYYQGLLIGPVLEKMHQLDLTHLWPANTVSALTLNEIRNKYIRGTSRSLLLGIEQPAVAKELNTSHLFAHRQKSYEQLTKELEGQQTFHLIGCDTPFTDHFFDVVIMTDYIRVFHPYMQRMLLQELHRIARQVVWIHGDDHMPAWASETLMEQNKIDVPSVLARFQPDIYIVSSGLRKGHLKERNYWSSIQDVTDLCAELNIPIHLENIITGTQAVGESIDVH